MSAPPYKLACLPCAGIPQSLPGSAPLCVPPLAGWNSRIEYEPGTGSLTLFPNLRLETCDGAVAAVQATLELETGHIGKGCDRDTYSEKALHRLCGETP